MPRDFPGDLPQMLTVKEAAQTLRVSDMTIRRWARAGILKSVLIEGIKPDYRHYRFSREVIYQMVKPALPTLPTLEKQA